MENKYLKQAGNIHLSYFLEAADILGIDYEVIIPRLTAMFKYKKSHWFINNTVTPLTNAPSSKLARTKNFTNMVLKSFNIPVPTQKKINNSIEALKFFDSYKQIVFKPGQNIGGKGVSILPRNEEELLAAYEFAKENDKAGNVLAEEYIEGDNYRVLVVGDEVVSVIKRVPAHVIGNGASNISKLIEQRNLERDSKGLLPIQIDTELNHQLQSQDLTLESIPDKGVTVQLRKNANMTTGGTTKEIKESVNEYYKQICIEAVKALDLEYGGVDLITPDISKKTKCAINEVNFNPGLRIHYKVEEGKPVKVAVDILKYIMKKYENRS